MKKIIIVYPDMMVGGSTSSLLSLLNSFNYEIYDVDLLLGSNSGPLFEYIPKSVNILPQAHPYNNHFARMIMLLKRPKVIIIALLYKLLAFVKNNELLSQQRLAYEKIKIDRIVEGEYDVAISFLEFWSTAFVENKVSARKKIAWFHMDYRGTKINPRVDKECYGSYDKIVLVSKDCKNSFDTVFPDYNEKTVFIENSISHEIIRSHSNQKINFLLDDKKINLVTTCRIDFSSKGLDRALIQLKKLKESSNKLDINWYIIGDGPDFRELKKLINKYKLQEAVILLGQKINPFPYMKKMDFFFLPSHYEGKPVSVTEAQLLEIPIIVTNYASAKDQILPGTGIVIDNNSSSIYSILQEINNHNLDIQGMKDSYRTVNLINQEKLLKVYDLFN